MEAMSDVQEAQNDSLRLQLEAVSIEASSSRENLRELAASSEAQKADMSVLRRELEV